MTRLVSRVVMWLALAAVIGVAGGHTIYYLLNWEWNRASMAGVAFVGAVVVAATVLVLGRLSRVEAKLDLLLAGRTLPRQSAEVDETVAAVQVEPRPDFPWLSRSPALALALWTVAPREAPDPAVFIPVFLAAGLIVSALAGVIERVAAFSERRKGAPPGGTPALRKQPRWLLGLIPALGAVVVVGAVWGLYWASHYWSTPMGPGVTTMTVDVHARGPTTSEIEVVETIGRYCAVDSGTDVTFVAVEPGPDGNTLLRLEPLLDSDAQGRYIGCVEDAVLEWHQLTVTATSLEGR